MSSVFGLDIGTRNVVGTVGYKTEDETFVVIAQYVRQHETRSMLDGQIHDIGRVARTIGIVKSELEKQIGEPLTEVCIAAAGRVLKTITTHVEYQYPEETVVTSEDVHTLDLLGIERAQDLLKEKNDTSYKFYCVGYSVVKYYLNEDLFISLEGHKARRIGEDIIVTFLPEDVVDGLYSAVGQAGLRVANLTLEPIAAIDVAIPETFRMLNIALVDVGAGTSDISITKDGSIIAFGMIPYAGDELTEVIVQQYLVDFKTAEHIKLTSTIADEVTYEDIMTISHTIPSQEVWDLVEPVVDKITTEVAAKIRELNGDKSVSACFVVGGGGKVHGYTEHLAQKLGLAPERVALRGEEVLKEVIFEQEDIKKDPLLVTPIGICLNYYDQKNNFIMVRFNGERIKLYDNDRLTIVDAALTAGFPRDQLFPKRGMPINFTVNGAPRIARGEAGEPAIVTLNGNPANINTPLEPNCEITITPSTAGEAATYRVSQLEEYSTATISFEVNGKRITCPKFVEVNGSLEPGSYRIHEGDVIETRNFYTVGQVAEFMDVEIDESRTILVNNRTADLNTLVYDNFSIEWNYSGYRITLDEPVAPEEEADDWNASEPELSAAGEAEEPQEPGLETAGKQAAAGETAQEASGENGIQQKSGKEASGVTAGFAAEGAPGEIVSQAEIGNADEPETIVTAGIFGALEAMTDTPEAAGTDRKKAPWESLNDLDSWKKPVAEATSTGAGQADAGIPQEDLPERADTVRGETGAGETERSAVERGEIERLNAEPIGVDRGEARRGATAAAETTTAPEPKPEPEPEPEPQIINPCVVLVNGDPVTLSGKDQYIFIDIFEEISFDLSAGGGRAIITLLNGRDAQYTEALHDGDQIDIHWEEKE